MTTESIQVSGVIPASPERVYRAWLNSEEHRAMTGGGAKIKPVVGSKHSACDGYIEGEILELEPERRIVMSWRTSEFPKGSEHSRLEILFEPTKTGTKLTFLHTNIPDGQGQRYKKGWKEFYLEPMKLYFAANQPELPGPAPKKPALKIAAKKTPAKKTPAKKTPAKKTPAKKTPAKKTPAKKTPAKKS